MNISEMKHFSSSCGFRVVWLLEAAICYKGRTLASEIE